MATRVPARWNHFQHLQPYRRGNSPEGIRKASQRPGVARAIDLDFQMSRDDIFLNTHWHTPEREGFRYLDGKGAVCRRRFARMPARVAVTLRTLDGYTIQTGGTALRLAAEGRVRVEAELKAVPSQRALERLADTAKAYYGDDWQQWVQIKMLAAFPWRTALKRAHRAGFITFVIGYSGDPAALPAYVDHYRMA